MTKGDPENVYERLYKQISALLSDLERGDDDNLRVRIQAVMAKKSVTKEETLRAQIEAELGSDVGISIRERIAGLVAIARIADVYGVIRKADEPERGSKVAAYGAAFKAKTNAVGGRKRGARPTLAAVTDAFSDTDTDPDDPIAA